MTKLYLIVLAAYTFGCDAHQESVAATHTRQISVNHDNKLANLERAARYPWMDDGCCAVQEASGDWATLVERCYGALDLHRIRFVDNKKACPIAQAGAISADEVTQLVGICLLAQPELVVGVVIVVGVVVVAAAIASELQQLRCKCMCMDIDGLGKKHGPYPNDRTANESQCKQRCSQQGYAGGGFCG